MLIVGAVLLTVVLVGIAQLKLSVGAENLMEEETGLAAVQAVWNTYSFQLFPRACGAAFHTGGGVPIGDPPGAYDVVILTLKDPIVCSLWPRARGAGNG